MIGVGSRFEKMGLDEKKSEEESSSDVVKSENGVLNKGKNEENVEDSGRVGGSISRQASESSISATEDDEEDEDRSIELGPQFTLKEQFEKDKVFFSYFGLNMLFVL